MRNAIRYEVIEDNGGGLHLFVFMDYNGDGNEKVIYEHSGYEYIKGQLQDDLSALHNGVPVTDFDGCEDNPEADYKYIAEHEHGYQIIAACYYFRSPEIYQDKMGLSGLREFNLADE